jgi:serine/threonine protein kinase
MLKAGLLKAGQKFAGYELQELVGTGQTGAIYRALEVRLQRPVALRIVAPDLTTDPVIRARLNRELTTLASVDHPNVAPLYETGESNGRIFIASRWVDGTSLNTLVREQGALEPKRAVRIVTQVASALQATRALGIMHRNVKPSTVLVTSTDHAYLTDFGLARRPEDSAGLTVEEHLLDSFDYVAPEYISGMEIDARVDIYGLGCVLYEALTAEVPYPRSGSAAKMYAHVSAEPPSVRAKRPEIPERLDAVVKRALAKDPDDRPQTPGEFAVDMTGALDLSSPVWAAIASPAAAPDPLRVPSLSAPPAVEAVRNSPASPEAHPPRGTPVDHAASDGPRPVTGLRSDRAGDGRADAGDRQASGFSEPVYFRSHRRSRSRWMGWAVAVLFFMAAPLALLLALIH